MAKQTTQQSGKPNLAKVALRTGPDFWEKYPWEFSIFFVLALILFRQLLNPSALLFGTDWLAGGYAGKTFFKEMVNQYHVLSAWIPYLYGGVPQAASTGDFYYPFSLVMRSLMPIHYFQVWLYIVHFTLAGVFMWMLLRRLGHGRDLATLGGISFMLTGMMVSLVYAGHDGKIIVTAYLPLMFWIIHRAVEKGNVWNYLLGGVIFALSLSVFHLQMTYYMMFAASGWWAFLVISQAIRDKDWAKLGFQTGFFALLVGVGFALTAILYLPFFDYIPFSPRGGPGRGFEFATSWAMQPIEVINALLPQFSGTSVDANTYWGANAFKLHSEYIGVLAILGAILALVVGYRKGRTWLFFGLALFALTVALGASTPIFKLYYQIIPGFKQTRALGMIFFVVTFCVNVLAIEGLAALDLPKLNPRAQKTLIWIGLGIGGLLLIGFLLFFNGGGQGTLDYLAKTYAADASKAQALQSDWDPLKAGVLRIFFFGALFLTGMLLWVTGLVPRKWIVPAMALLVVVDLLSQNAHFVKKLDSVDQAFGADDAVQFLKQDHTNYRVFPFRYQMQGNYLMVHHVQSIIGEHGNQLMRFNQFLGAGEKTYVDFHNLSSPNILNLANVKYILSQQPIGMPGFRLVANGQTKVVQNMQGLPRAFLVPSFEVIQEDNAIIERIKAPTFDPRKTVVLEEAPSGFTGSKVDSVDSVALDTGENPWGTTVIERYEPNRVTLTVDPVKPAILVLLDNYYKDWTAYVNGQKAPILRGDYTFRAIPLAAGHYSVEFRWEPAKYNLGFWITALSSLILLGLFVFWFIRVRPRV